VFGETFLCKRFKTFDMLHVHSNMCFLLLVEKHQDQVIQLFAKTVILRSRTVTYSQASSSLRVMCLHGMPLKECVTKLELKEHLLQLPRCDITSYLPGNLPGTAVPTYQGSIPSSDLGPCGCQSM